MGAGVFRTSSRVINWFFSFVLLSILLFAVHRAASSAQVRTQYLNLENQSTDHLSVKSCSPSCKIYDYERDECSELGHYSLNSPECLALAPPTNFIRLLREVILGFPVAGSCNKASEGGCSIHAPYIAEQRHWGFDWPPFGYAMMGRVRLENFRAAIEDVNSRSIPGAIIELGVWRGGGMMYAAGINKESPFKRKLYLYDAFGTIKDYSNHAKFLAVDEDMVTDSFRTMDLLDEHVHFEVGLFQDTVPNWNPRDQIAVLRVDGNFYDSYQDAMFFLYESVQVNGIVIFDDVLSHQAVMEFWKEFSSEQNIGQVNLVNIDKHSAWFRKPKKASLDWRFFKAYRDSNIEGGSNGCPQFVAMRTGGKCHESWKRAETEERNHSSY